jgi:hypothetical protein
MAIKTNNAALIPPIVAVISFILSPDFYNILPDKVSHIIAATSVLWAAFQNPAIRRYVEVRKETEETSTGNGSQEGQK